MEQKEQTSNWFLMLVGACCIVAIFVSFYFFYLKKDYSFFVETSCDPSADTCFHRDCSIEDECPPNNLSDYKKYKIKAYDFASCTNGDCSEICKSGSVMCKEEACTEEDIEDGTCTAPQPINDYNYNEESLDL